MNSVLEHKKSDLSLIIIPRTKPNNCVRDDELCPSVIINQTFAGKLVRKSDITRTM